VGEEDAGEGGVAEETVGQFVSGDGLDVLVLHLN
jgi:hypothetical protein